jgi:glycine/D-amino acid oxidase-like deaminating enzyme
MVAMRVLICGGGVVGASIAYFLSASKAEVVVIERRAVAGAASGKSGGFLALDWCDGSALAPLARRSFALHAEVAAAHGNPWGYRRLETLGVAMGAGRRPGAARDPSLPSWIAAGARLQHRLGTPATTAQVHPAAFTSGMLDAAIARGARLHRGGVEGLVRSGEGGRITGVVADGAPVEGDAVVIAMGPWSVLAAQWLPMPMIYGLKGHSLVLQSREPVSAHALFVEGQGEDGSPLSLEVYPRADGTTYVCGLSSEAPLPLDPAEVAPDPGASERLRGMAARLAPAFAEAEVLASRRATGRWPGMACR